MQTVLFLIALSLLLYLAILQFYKNVKYVADEEAEAKARRKFNRERARANAYAAAYDDLLHNTKIEIVTRGDWSDYGM